MSGRMQQVVRALGPSSKYVGVPLAVAVGWAVALLGLMSSISQPTPLQTSIQKVLSTSRAPAESNAELVSRPSTVTDRQAHRGPRVGRGAPTSVVDQCLGDTDANFDEQTQGLGM
jgi:hypothetical protein